MISPGKVLIIGGGFAGLSAGVALAQAGRQVRVLEQKPYLGGRARSFHYPPMNSVVDNGQHIFMGCYHSTIQLLQTLGTLDRVRFQPRLNVHFTGKEEGLTSLRLPRLPPPWHLMVGTLLSNSFSWREKIEIARLGRALRAPQKGSQAPNRLTVDEWLAQHGQSERLRRNFWDLVCIAALNEDPHLAPARLFEPVLRLALFQSPDDSRIGLARTGLSECYADQAATFIRRNHGEVELGQDVTSLQLRGSENGAAMVCEGVRLADNSLIQAETVLSAVPPPQLARLLPKACSQLQGFLAELEVLRPAPIISINLWLDRAVTDLDFIGLRGTTIQWLFNKGRLLGTKEKYLSLVISGAHNHIEKEKSALVDIALEELKELFPPARAARLLHSLVIKERNATFSPPSDSPNLRPGVTTPVAGLYLAGDWTETGLPATIESAVKSGYTAASEILNHT